MGTSGYGVSGGMYSSSATAYHQTTENHVIFLQTIPHVQTYHSERKDRQVWANMAHLVMLRSYPMSRSRSASSITKNLTEARLRLLVLCRWSMRRPGVPTRMLMPRRRRAFSAFFFSPPMRYPGTTHTHDYTRDNGLSFMLCTYNLQQLIMHRNRKAFINFY